ncbi:MAG: hypothetical protein U0R24_03900 [Solirubrobacterales bacterium]
MARASAARSPLAEDGAVRRWAEKPRAGWLILGACMVVAAILVLIWNGSTSLTIDEWPYFVDRSHWTLENIMRPTGGHLLALGMVLYNADYSLFGPEPHLPLTLVTIGFQCLVSGLVYAYARRRIGPLPALIPAILILFLGAGWEILMSSAVLPNQMAMAAGIGMLLALDRRDRRGDALAFVLLACSIASFSIGLAFAAAAALRILLERRELGLRRLVIVVVPLALYAVWYVWALKYEQGNFAASNIGSMPSAIFDQINASLSAVTGLFRVDGRPAIGDALILDTTRTTALVLVAGFAVVWRIVKGRPLSPAAWTTLALIGLYAVLVGLGLNEFRKPDASRYAYMFSVLLMLVSADLLAGIRIPRVWAIAAVAALAVSLVSNIAQMHTAGTFFESESELNRAEAGALELVRPYVAPDFVAESGRGYGVFPYRDMTQPAVSYFDAVDRLGSPAFDPGRDRRGVSRTRRRRPTSCSSPPSSRRCRRRRSGRPAAPMRSPSCSRSRSTGRRRRPTDASSSAPSRPGATFASSSRCLPDRRGVLREAADVRRHRRALHRGPRDQPRPRGQERPDLVPRRTAYDGPWKVGLAYTGKVTACPISG